MTALPFCDTVALHALVTFWSPGNVKPRLQPLMVDLPVLATVTLATKPPAHSLCLLYVTWQPLVPPPPVVGGATVVGLAGGVRLVGLAGGVVGVTLPRLYENEVTARPVPLTQGSKPACTLVMYQERWP